MSAILIKAANTTDTTLWVSGGDEFIFQDAHLFAPLGGTIQIDAEQITYTAYYQGQFQIAVRGANGTSAAAHLIGAVVTPVSPNLGSVNVVFMNGAGAPTDTTTGKYFAQIGSLYSDSTNGNLYVNAGTMASPTWKLVTRAA